jgi:hypothetical protein
MGENGAKRNMYFWDNETKDCDTQMTILSSEGITAISELKNEKIRGDDDVVNNFLKTRHGLDSSDRHKMFQTYLRNRRNSRTMEV